MAYMNYKEGTGIRARSDLAFTRLAGPAASLADTEPFTDVQLIRVAEGLLVLVTAARNAGESTVRLSVRQAQRLADALLSAEHRNAAVPPEAARGA